MSTARAFSELYQLVAKKCQDESTNGYTTAKAAINTVIKELTTQFKLPEMKKGLYGDVSITVPAQSAGSGYQKCSLVVTDLSRLLSVWFEQNGRIYELDETESEEDWLETVDNNTTGDPEVFRYLAQDSSGGNYIQIWPGASAAWVANTNNGTLKFSYAAQLAQLSGDSDVPNIPYEIDTILVNGAVYEMACDQGDNALKDIFYEKYNRDKGELRAWLIKQQTRDGIVGPKNPQGVFGNNLKKQGYRLA